MNHPPGRGRRGLGTIPLVVILIVIVALVQVHQQTFFGQVITQTSHATVGRVAMQAAQSAVQEARGVVCDRLEKPDSAEFSMARREGVAPFSSDALQLSPGDLPLTQALIREAFGSTHEVFDVKGALETKSWLDPTGLETDGVLTIEAAARSRLVKSVVRRVWKSWLYRVVELAPSGGLRPVVGMIRAADAVLRGRWDAHQIVKVFLEQDLPTMIRDITKVLADLDSEKAKASDDQLKQAIDQLRAIYAPLVEGAGGGQLGTILSPLATRFQALPALPANPADAVMVHKDTALAVGEFDLQGDLDELIPRHRQLREEAERLAQAVKQSQSADQATVQVNQQYAAALLALAQQMGRIEDRYLRFRDAFTLVGSSTPEFASIVAGYTRIDPVARNPRMPAVPALDPRVTVLLDAPKLDPSPDEAVRRTLARLGRDRGFQGILEIENQGRPLTLSGTLRGRWTLVALGPLTINGLKRADAQNDLFTVVHAGSREDALSLSGTIEATVVGSGANMTIAKETRVTGGLVLQDVDPRSRIEPTVTDPEQVTPDPLRIAPPERLRHVVVSPWTRSLGSARDS